MKDLIILLIFTSTVFAQIEKTQNYFPLAVGNVWQYWYDSGLLLQVKVMKDSTDSLGYKYYLLTDNQGSSRWAYRTNSSKDSVFAIFGGGYRDWLIYKFPITYPRQWWRVLELDTTEGSFPITAIVFDIFPISFWGRVTTAVDIRYHSTMDTVLPTIEWMYTDIIADGLGLVWWGNEAEYKILIGCVIDGDTIGIVLNVDDEKENILDRFELYQNYPNPFNSSTTISFTILKEEFVELSVYNCLGEKIRVLKNELLRPGNYTVKFDASGLVTGTYFYRLKTSKGSITKKMLYLK
jgi:hypothetical protein